MLIKKNKSYKLKQYNTSSLKKITNRTKKKEIVPKENTTANRAKRNENNKSLQNAKETPASKKSSKTNRELIAVSNFLGVS